jgi:hypothetical protein
MLKDNAILVIIVQEELRLVAQQMELQEENVKKDSTVRQELHILFHAHLVKLVLIMVYQLQTLIALQDTIVKVKLLRQHQKHLLRVAENVILAIIVYWGQRG